ncbi:hypothetical protein MtrunA17_Chr3g0127821 [Medicago truncatula]|uniref:Uncharacterized protein n=1 Tax=Medicago truncatula TaxID=3880 RepID=A0A396J3C0_MEDTR|nr:hypothetical protein MtrunA17_Chr3g0127821 [Medicago truncatula]
MVDLALLLPLKPSNASRLPPQITSILSLSLINLFIKSFSPIMLYYL